MARKLPFGALVVLLAALPWLVVLSAESSAYHAARYAGDGTPRLHWEADGHDKPYVNFVDGTGSGSWPVTAAANDWDTDTNRLNVNRVISGGACNSHCVQVNAFAFNDGCSVAGRARGFADANGHLLGLSRVELNNSCSLTDGEEAKITCQEMGHIVGLKHRDEFDTCMHRNINAATRQEPDNHDRETVDGSHDHNH
jgi:hypothetical protein